MNWGNILGLKDTNTNNQNKDTANQSSFPNLSYLEKAMQTGSSFVKKQLDDLNIPGMIPKNRNSVTQTPQDINLEIKTPQPQAMNPVTQTPQPQAMNPVTQTPQPQITQSDDGSASLKKGRDAWASKRYEEAFSCYLDSAQKGNIEAQNLLGNCYKGGYGTQKDIAKALLWYEKAAAKGERYALFNLGQLYKIGDGVPKDWEKTRFYWEQALQAGHHTAKEDLYYLNDLEMVPQTIVLTAQELVNLANSLKQNYNKQAAFHYYNQAAQLGDASAQNLLGICYYEGEGTMQDDEAAFYWFQQAASQGNCYGFFNLAEMYEYGRGRAIDYKIALDYYQRAKAAGHNHKSTDLRIQNVTSLLQGTHIIAVDASMSDNDLVNKANYCKEREMIQFTAQCAKILASRGFPSAQEFLADYYRMGSGVEHNLQEAHFWYQELVNKECSSTGYACYRLGQMYEFGMGVPMDSERAKQYYQRGISFGNEACSKCLDNLQEQMYLLAEQLKKQFPNAGDGPVTIKELTPEEKQKQDNLKIFHATKMLADLGDWRAIDEVGKYYLLGDCIEKDYSKALEYFSKNEQMELGCSHFYLGYMYENGFGVPTDYVQAFQYYRSVIDFKWITQAKDAMDNLTNKLLASSLQTPEVYTGLGYLYEYGRGVKADYEKAAMYWQSALDKGGDQETITKELEIIRQLNDFKNFGFHAAEQLHPVKLCELQNEWVEKNPLLSLEYTKCAARQEAPDAMIQLGEEYCWGRICERDLNAGFKLLRQMAAEGYSEACIYLGLCYMDGLFIEKDTERAREFLQKAYDLDNPEAKEYLDQLPPKEASPERTETEKEEEAQKPSAPKELPENLDAYFEGIIGMKSVKEQLEKIYHSTKLKIKRNEILKSRGEDPIKDEQGYNFVILGNPGTGKTIIARMIAKILYDIGVRKSDHLEEADRSRMVSEYIGGTEKKVNTIIEKAMGGTLFIDEAYTLYRESSEQDVGQDAIAALLKAMEDHRDKMSVIIAGYKQPMRNMIKNANEGFGSRFTYTIDLPDYTDNELLAIAHSLMSAKHYLADEYVDEAILKCIHHDRLDDTFGNARYIRELVGRAIENQSTRLQNAEEYNEDALFTLCAEDFWQSDLEEDNVENCLKELVSMIGLQQVKAEVGTLINRLQVQMEMEKRGLRTDQDMGTLHMCFKGNPGTGKTTVARLIGRLYSAMGILKRKDVFVECNRASLIGQYMGETAQKVKKAVESAMGGILFIDEAYSLVQDNRDSFGKEAVDTLVAEIENNRKSMVVIFAGYSKDMDEFFKNNQGLKSRVPIELIFEDYSEAEMFFIALNMIKERGLEVSEDAAWKFKEILAEKSQEEDFGNARGVRNMIDMVVRCQNTRIASLLRQNPTVENDVLTMITLADIENL